ncbi:MAG: SAM hydrolase/SAM-dependent halogenase family protein [Acidimicrobiales bacterium]
MIFFLSDYGLDDEFVGVVHAVLHRWAPLVPVIDLAHGVPPYDVASGASMLERCAPVLTTGVVLAVVDPGVGTDRLGVAVGVSRPGGPTWLVGPDNGLLVPLADALGGASSVLVLERPDGLGTHAGPTFDGRDLFAPVAARLVRGDPPGELGAAAPVDSLVRLPAHQGTGGPSVGVRWVDRFGNVELDLDGSGLDELGLALGEWAEVTVVGPTVTTALGRRVAAFGDLASGELGILVDSAGRAALVVYRDSAARLLGLGGSEAIRLVARRMDPAGT